MTRETENLARRENEDTYYAWYSLKQERIRRDSFFRTVDGKSTRSCPGCIYWRDSAGELVEVTMVSKTMDHECNTDVLNDIVYRGVVHSYAGICRR